MSDNKIWNILGQKVEQTVEKEVDIGKELMTNHISQSWYNHLSDD
jgi:hypothetical protein